MRLEVLGERLLGKQTVEIDRLAKLKKEEAMATEDTLEQIRSRVVTDLSTLIARHSRFAAGEQYAPQRTQDSSDEYIIEHKKWVTELRDLRQRFEDLVTGLL